MAQTIGRGGTITLDAYYRNGANALTDPTNPKCSIIDRDGVTVVLLDDPTRHVGVGHYQYDYAVAVDADLGAWAIRWYGTVGGNALEDEDGFTVVAAGTISNAPFGPGPCTPWIDGSDLFSCAPCSGIADEDQDDDLADAMALAASEALYVASGGRFPGVCTQTIRPCHSGRGCSCARSCGCSGVDELRLPGFPVVSVDEVVVDGETLDAGLYQVLDWKDLVLLRPTPGTRTTWPCCQDLALPSTEVGTFEVTFSFGLDVPQLGVMAARALACDWYRGCSGGDTDCSTPAPQVTTRNTQGTTLTFVKPPTIGRQTDGSFKTGLDIVDTFLGIFPPKRRRTVSSPDVGPAARRIT